MRNKMSQTHHLVAFKQTDSKYFTPVQLCMFDSFIRKNVF